MSSAVIQQAPIANRSLQAFRSRLEWLRDQVARNRQAIPLIRSDKDIKGIFEMTADNGAAQRPVPAGDNLKVEFEDGIAWLKINRPEKRNAMSVGLADDMNRVLDELETDDRC